MWREYLATELRIWLGNIAHMRATIPTCQVKRYFHVAPPHTPQESVTGRRLWHKKIEVGVPLMNA